MSVDQVITGYPDYNNMSFYEELLTTYGGEVDATSRFAQPSNSSPEMPAVVPAPRIAPELGATALGSAK